MHGRDPAMFTNALVYKAFIFNQLILDSDECITSKLFVDPSGIEGVTRNLETLSA